MTNDKEALLEPFEFYGIAVLSITGVQNNFEIEAEAKGIYKLLDDGYVVAPYCDLNELCRFILL
jgi:hypothetical protein